MIVLLAPIAVATLALLPPTASEDGITVEATVNGQPVAGATSNAPVRLEPDEPAVLGLTIANDTEADIEIQRVRFAGSALGLTLIAYDVPVSIPVPAGDTSEAEVPLLLFDLERQATGLVPGSIALYDDDGTVVASQDFTLDVRGSVTSVVGLFGIFILVATILSVAAIAQRVATRRLPPNRFRRGLRFATAGVGLGLTFTIALAAFRVLSAEGSIWIPLVVIPTIAGFALGLASPGVLSAEPDEIDLLDTQPADGAASGDEREAASRATKVSGGRRRSGDEGEAASRATKVSGDQR